MGCRSREVPNTVVQVEMPYGYQWTESSYHKDQTRKRVTMDGTLLSSLKIKSRRNR